ncbi:MULTISPECIES: hypothetical protein [unclassified Novosphingobium]|uniref:hypothetical protein n=1 Tax=unclassified Novosphingobium TaxID=2644732 RepID=UPI001061802F|nr:MULTISPECIES: hypothetical protein [unclassified Novosphingobium]
MHRIAVKLAADLGRHSRDIGLIHAGDSYGHVDGFHAGFNGRRWCGDRAAASKGEARGNL